MAQFKSEPDGEYIDSGGGGWYYSYGGRDENGDPIWNKTNTGSGGGGGFGGGGGGSTGGGNAFTNFFKDPQNVVGTIGAAGSLAGAAGSSGPSSGSIGNQRDWFHDSPALPMGLNTLLELLSSRGKTDPALLNRQLTANARNTEGQQQRQTGSAAMRNLQNSGVSQAINAAIGAAGADREANIIAKDTALEEQRKRQDLQLLLDLIIRPGIDYSAIDAGQYNARQQSDTAKQGAYINALAQFAELFAGDD